MINTLKLINYKQCFDSLSWYFFVKYVRSCSRMNDIPLYFLIVKEVIHKIISDKIATHTQLSDKLCHDGSNEERDFFFMWTIVLSLTFQEENRLNIRCCMETTRGFYCEKSCFCISLCTIGYESHISLQIVTSVRYLKVPARISLEVLSDEPERVETVSCKDKFFFNNNNVRLDGCAGSNDKHERNYFFSKHRRCHNEKI